MNDHFKIKNGWAKHALRIAMAGLVPKNILWRKDKLGFEAPKADWIKAARASMVSAIRRSAILNSMCRHKPDFDRIDDATFWKLFNIAKWEEIYSVQPAPLDAVRGAEPEQEAVPLRIRPEATLRTCREPTSGNT